MQGFRIVGITSAMMGPYANWTHVVLPNKGEPYSGKTACDAREIFQMAKVKLIFSSIHSQEELCP